MSTPQTIATADMIRDLADAACAKPDGTRWKSVSVTQMKNTCVRFYEEMVRRNDGGELTLGQLLTADMVEAYCDGETENRRRVGDREIAAEDHRRTVGVASIPPLARHVMKMLKRIDPEANMADLDVLISHAEEQCKARAAAANAEVPPYSVFFEAAARLGECMYADGTSRTEVSKAVYLLAMVASCPAREKMFLYTRAADSDGFDPEEAHSRAVLDALCAEHPHHADSMTLCTVLFTGGEPTAMVLGVHKCSDPRKSEYFHQLDLTVPILPAASLLIPVLHDGLKKLYADYVPDSFLLRGDTDGTSPFGRNWGTNVLKPTTGHTAGILRKSIEQESFRLHMEDATAFPLSQCAEVCARCQHKPTTAMSKYVRKQLVALGGTEPPALVRQDAVGDDDTGGTDGGTDDTGGAVDATVDQVEHAFHPAESFEGPRAGYEFKTGVRGLGYYLIGYDFGPETTTSEDESIPRERVVYRPAEGAVPYLDKMRTRLCVWWSKEALARDFPVPDDLIVTLTSDQVDDLVTKYGLSESDVIIYGAPWEHTPDSDGSDAETLDLPAAEAPGDSPAPGDMELEATDEIAPAASTGNDIALVVRMTNGSTQTFHQSVFAAAYLVDTGGRDVARADTAFDDGALRVTWDEGDHGVFPAITGTTEAPEAAEAPDDGDAPGPTMQALLAAMAAAHESDRAAKRRRTD